MTDFQAPPHTNLPFSKKVHATANRFLFGKIMVEESNVHTSIFGLWYSSTKKKSYTRHWPGLLWYHFFCQLYHSPKILVWTLFSSSIIVPKNILFCSVACTFSENGCEYHFFPIRQLICLRILQLRIYSSLLKNNRLLPVTYRISYKKNYEIFGYFD